MQHKLNKVFLKNFCFVSESCQCICFALLLTRTNNCQNIKISNNFYAKSWKKQQKLWIMSNYLLNIDWVTVTACQFQFDIYCLCICCSFCVPFQKHYCYLFIVSLLLWSWVNRQKNLVEKRGVWEVFTLIISSIQIIYINNQSLYILYIKSTL